MFLLDFDMVSDGREHPSEVYVKVSSGFYIRNHVKPPPVLQVSSWCLGGGGGGGLRKNLVKPWA